MLAVYTILFFVSLLNKVQLHDLLYFDRFDEFGGSDDFTTDDVAFVLSQRGLLNYDADRSEDISGRSQASGVNAVRLSQIRGGSGISGMSDDEDNYD
jgi:hypothetical protein